MTLDQWLDSVDSNRFAARVARKVIKGCIYVPDCRAIDHQRTQLWSLSDYLVTAVSGGSIILIPREGA